jgi:transcriptional regulator with XRE-family HTH domain
MAIWPCEYPKEINMDHAAFRATLDELGWSQSLFARKSGLSDETISRYANNKQEVPQLVAWLLSLALDLHRIAGKHLSNQQIAPDGVEVVWRNEYKTPIGIVRSPPYARQEDAIAGKAKSNRYIGTRWFEENNPNSIIMQAGDLDTSHDMLNGYLNMPDKQKSSRDNADKIK